MKKTGWIAILILTLVVTVVWILADVVFTPPSNPNNQKAVTLSQSLDPNFDKSVLDQLTNIYIPPAAITSPKSTPLPSSPASSSPSAGLTTSTFISSSSSSLR